MEKEQASCSAEQHGMQFVHNTANSEHAVAGLSDQLSGLKNSKFYDKAQLIPPSDENRSSSTSTAAIKSHGSGGPILVNTRQRGNPLLQHVRRVPWQYEEALTADYMPSATTGVLFLSLKYHSLNPDYIHDRLRLLSHQYALRVLLVQVDCPDHHHAMKNLTRICLLADMTLVTAWSEEQAGRVVEMFKIFENKPPDMIMEKFDEDPYSKVISALCSLRPINKSDAVTLISTFGSLQRITKAKLEELELCPGLGPQKAAKLYSALHRSFKKS